MTVLVSFVNQEVCPAAGVRYYELLLLSNFFSGLGTAVEESSNSYAVDDPV